MEMENGIIQLSPMKKLNLLSYFATIPKERPYPLQTQNCA
jgi:hypothetical protein